MQRTSIQLSLVIAAAFLIFGFQNCSGVNFDGATTHAKSEVDPGTDGEVSDPVVQTPDEVVPNDDEIEVAFDPCLDLPIKNESKSCRDDVSDVKLQNIRGDRVVEVAKSLSVLDMQGALVVESAHKVSLQNIKGSAIISAKKVEGVLDFQARASGDALVIDANSVGKIQNTKAPICIRSGDFSNMLDLSTDQSVVLIGRKSSKGSKPRIKKLQNLKGVVILKDVDVDEILDLQGSKLVLDNVVIGKMQNVKSDIYLRNSMIGQEMDVRGKRIDY